MFSAAVLLIGFVVIVMSVNLNYCMKYFPLNDFYVLRWLEVMAAAVPAEVEYDKHRLFWKLCLHQMCFFLIYLLH